MIFRNKQFFTMFTLNNVQQQPTNKIARKLFFEAHNENI